MITEIKTSCRLTREFVERHPLFIALIWAFVLAAPFMHMRYSYYDDIWRDTFGYGWPDYTFRPLANCFYHLVTMAQGKIQNIHPFAPYSTYFSVVIFILTGWLVARAAGVKSHILRTLAAASLFASPFMIEVIMFRYDGITYAIGAFCAVLPLLKVDRWYTLRATILLCIAIQFYLPCALVFPIAVMAYATTLTVSTRKTVFFILQSVIALVIALGIEYIILHVIFHVGGPYGNNQLVAPVEGLMVNAKRVFDYVYESSNLFNVINLVVLLAVAIVVAFIGRLKEEAKGEWILNIGLILSAPIFVLLAEIAINLTENAPRYYLPFSFIYVFWIAFILRASREAFVPIIIAGLTALSALPAIAACTTAIDDQIAFQREVASEMLAGIDTTDRSLAINTTGTIDSPDAIHSQTWIEVSRDYPVLRTMKSAYIDDPYNAWKTLQSWGMIGSDPGLVTKITQTYVPIFVHPCHMKLIRHSLYGNIYDDQKTLLIDYSKVKCP